MLLVDISGRRIAATLRGAATAPYLLDRTRRSYEQARNFLYGFRSDWTALQGALHTELARSGWSEPVFAGGEAYRMEEGARRISSGAIQTGQFVRRDIEIRFYEQFPYATSEERVIFPRPDQVETFLQGAVNAERIPHMAAMALRHREARKGHAHRLPSTLADAAMLLAIDELRLVPFDRHGRVFLLGLSRSDLSIVDLAGGGDGAPVSDAPTHKAKKPAAKAEPAPRSKLPVAPVVVSPQVQALLEAAEKGTPFCEECAAALIAPPPKDPEAAAPPPAAQPAAPARSLLPDPPAVPSSQAQALKDAADAGAPFCEECAAAAANAPPAAGPAADMPAPPPSLPEPAPAPPVIEPVARSPLPDPPATPTAQAQALQDAAAVGAPFCEECAAAAQMANA